MSGLFYGALALFMLLCFILSLTVLVQESKSLGLGASFGGDAGDSLFGTSTAAVLKKATAWMGVIFITACLLLSFWSAKIGAGKSQAVPPSIEEVQGL